MAIIIDIHLDLNGEVDSLFSALSRLKNDVQTMADLDSAYKVYIQAFQQQRKILIAGNGGSAADAQRLAGELVSRFHFDRPALSAIALPTDTSILTAIGNDYGYEDVFARQVQAHGRASDVFIAISTSGNSPISSRLLRPPKRWG